MTSFGIIGLGWIGRRVAVRLPGAAAVLVRPSQAGRAATLVDPAVVCTSAADFIARRPAVALECALAPVLAEIGPELLAAGIDLVPLSLTALCDPAVEKRLLAAAAAGPGRLELAPGAVGSLDLLATAREEGLRRVVYRQLKPPAMWQLTPAAGLAGLDGIDRRTVILSGSVREVARHFPNNLNSSVGVAMAGLGLDATELELVADPALSETAHELEIEAGAGTVRLSVGGREVAPDGDPADYTTSSLIRIVHRRRAPVENLMADPVAFLQELVRAQRDGEAAVQQRVADAARRLGCTVERVRYRPGEVPMVAEFASAQAIDGGERESVVATYKGRGAGRSVIFFAHPDGEPVAATERWRHDPFAGVIEGARLHGWGVADDLAGVATLVQGLQAVLESGRAPLGDVILASTPSKRHARGVSALLHGGLRADAAVYLHPAESGVGMREIKAFASGLLEFRITVDGRAPDTSEISHAAFAHRAVNPIDKLWLIHRALQALDARRGGTVRHPALQQAIGRSTNLLVSHVAAGSGDVFARIAPTAVLSGSLSFPPPETLADVQSAIEAAVREAAAEDAWLSDHPPRLELVSGVTGAEVSPDHPLYRVVAEAVRRVTGAAPQVNPLHTSSDIRNPILQAGIPTVGLGPLGGDLTQNGLHDEWVDVEDYRRAVKVAADVIVGWCGTG